LKKHRVVIIGGGFGGVKAALELAGDSSFAVTLISNHSDFFVYSMLYRVATGGTIEIASVPLDEIFAHGSITIVQQTVTRIDRKNSEVQTNKGQKFSYDSLVCALGSVDNYYGIPGLEQYAFGVRTPNAAKILNNHLHKQLTQSKQVDDNYIVVGGGPTGVELAGALPAYINKLCRQHGLLETKIKVTLVESNARLLPAMPRDISFTVKRRLKKLRVKVLTRKTVDAQTPEGVMIDDKLLKSKTVIWTAGAKNNPIFEIENFKISSRHKVQVDQFLQAEPNIYVIGDNADTTYSGMAQTALYDGVYIAKNLKRSASGKARLAYKPKKPIYVVPAGAHWAAVLWGKFRIYGVFGWWLRRLADFIAYHDYEPWYAALERWLAEARDNEECRICSSNNK